MGYSPWGRKESDITEHTTPAKLYHLPHWEKAFFPEGRQDLMCPVFPYLVFLTLKKWPIRSQSSDHLCNLGLSPPASASSSGRWENNPCLHSSQTAMEAPGTRVGPRTQSPSPMWAGLVGQAVLQPLPLRSNCALHHHPSQPPCQSQGPTQFCFRCFIKWAILQLVCKLQNNINLTVIT